jgi:hypothetical protein
MSTQLAANYMGMPVDEIVPEAAALKGISRSQLLVGRRRVRMTPQTGASAGTYTSATAGTSANGNIIQFVLADSTSLLDMNSVVLSGTLQVFGTGASRPCLDDGPAFVRRISTAINGTLADDTDLAHRFANASVYASSDRATYSGALSFANYWAQNPALAVSGATNVAYAVGDLSGAQIAANARVNSATGFQFAIPLSVLSSIYRTKQYFPLSQLGEMVIQIVCASPGEACFQRTGATDAGYALSDLALEADFVQPHYRYSELLNHTTQLASEDGLVVAFDATIGTQSQGIPSATGTNSITTSLATNNLRKIICCLTPVDYQASPNYPTLSAFPHAFLNNVQWRCGSLYFPSQTANNTGRIWWMTQSAFNGGDPLHHSNGVIDYNTFNKTTGGGAGSTTWGSAIEGQQAQYFGDTCIVAYGFDCLKGGEELMADGISVLGQAGSQIITNWGITVPSASASAFSAAFPSGFIMNVYLTRTRYLLLRGGSVRIEGV